MPAKQIVDKGLSVRATEQLVKRLQAPINLQTEKQPHPETAVLENAFSEKFRMPVKIKSNGKKGQLVIPFNNIEELEELL